MNIKETALFWLDSGVSSVPLGYRSKVPLVKWTEFKTRLPSKAQIDLWYDDNPLKNLALICGWNGLIVLDFDRLDSYVAWHIYQLECNRKILETYRVMSNRGVHVYYWLAEPVRLTTIQHALFEVKSSGRLCTTPPSIHESGKPYRSSDNPANIKTVKPDEILNYSPLALHPVEVVWPTRSRFAPTSLNNESSLISQIKERIRMLDFFPNARRLDNEGRFYLANCPFHQHRDNFWIDAKSGRGGCYAGCGNFDVISLFGKMNGISDKEAILLLSREL